MCGGRIPVEVKSLLHRYRNNSISRGLWISNSQVESMGEKGLNANLLAQIVPSKAGYDSDKKLVLNIVTSKATKASYRAVIKMVSEQRGDVCKWGPSRYPLVSTAKSKSLSPAQ
jgi:hypothetical protein